MSEVLPGYDIITWNLIIAPPGLPAPILGALNRAFAATVAETDVQNRLLFNGLVPWSGTNTPEVTRAFHVQEVERFRAIVERTGVRLQP